MITVFSKDSLRRQVESISGGAMTVLYDRYGVPSVMYVIPRMTLGDLAVAYDPDTNLVTNPRLDHLGCLTSDVHPAFKFRLPQDSEAMDARIPSEIFIGAFKSRAVEVAGGKKVLASFPGKPEVNVFFNHQLMTHNKNSYPDKFEDYSTWKEESPEKGWHLLNTFEAGLLLMLQYKYKSIFDVANGTGYKCRLDFSDPSDSTVLEMSNSGSNVVVIAHFYRPQLGDISKFKRGYELVRVGDGLSGRGTILFTCPVSVGTITCSNMLSADVTDLSRDVPGYVIVLDRWVGDRLSSGDMIAVSDSYGEVGEIYDNVMVVEKVIYNASDAVQSVSNLTPFDPLSDMISDPNKPLYVMRGIYNLFGLDFPGYDLVADNTNFYIEYATKNFGILDLSNIEYMFTSYLAKELVDGVFLLYKQSDGGVPIVELAIGNSNYVQYPIDWQRYNSDLYDRTQFDLIDFIISESTDINSTLSQYISRKGLLALCYFSGIHNSDDDLFLCFADGTDVWSGKSLNYATLGTGISSRAPWSVIVRPGGMNESFIELMKVLTTSGMIGFVTKDQDGWRAWDPYAHGYDTSRLVWPGLESNCVYYTPLDVTISDQTLTMKHCNVVTSTCGLMYGSRTFAVMSRGTGRRFKYYTSGNVINSLRVPYFPRRFGSSSSEVKYRKKYIEIYGDPRYLAVSPWHASFDFYTRFYTSRLVYVNCSTVV